MDQQNGAPVPDLHRRVRALAILQTFIGTEPAWRVERGIFELHCCDHESSSPSSSPPSQQVIPNYEASIRSLAWNLKLHPEHLNNDVHDINTVVRLPEEAFSRGTAIEQLTDEVQEQYTRFNQPFPSASTLYASCVPNTHHETRRGGALVCRRCGGNNVVIRQQQTRSADEGMTVFCTCETCGTRWKM